MLGTVKVRYNTLKVKKVSTKIPQPKVPPQTLTFAPEPSTIYIALP